MRGLISSKNGIKSALKQSILLSHQLYNNSVIVVRMTIFFLNLSKAEYLEVSKHTQQPFITEQII